MRGAEKPAQRPRPPPPPHSRRNPTGVAVQTTCCRFRCGWWPRASSDRKGREEKAGGRTRAASQAEDGARRGTKRAAGGSLRERVGAGRRPRAPRGQEGTAGALATRQRGARPGLAPPPAPPRPREGHRCGLPAPGHRGSRRGRGLAAPANGQGNGLHLGGPVGTVAFQGRKEIGAKRQRRMKKGTGNDRRGWGGVSGDMRSKPIAKVQPIRR